MSISNITTLQECIWRARKTSIQIGRSISHMVKNIRINSYWFRYVWKNRQRTVTMFTWGYKGFVFSSYIGAKRGSFPIAYWERRLTEILFSSVVYWCSKRVKKRWNVAPNSFDKTKCGTRNFSNFKFAKLNNNNLKNKLFQKVTSKKGSPTLKKNPSSPKVSLNLSTEEEGPIKGSIKSLSFRLKKRCRLPWSEIRTVLPCVRRVVYLAQGVKLKYGL